jgi:hypothetical protein
MAVSDGAFSDAHQALLPPLTGEETEVTFEPGEPAFGLYMAGPKFTSFTDPARPNQAKIDHTARVFPVKAFQGPDHDKCVVGGFRGGFQRRLPSPRCDGGERDLDGVKR